MRKSKAIYKSSAKNFLAVMRLLEVVLEVVFEYPCIKVEEQRKTSGSDYSIWLYGPGVNPEKSRIQVEEISELQKCILTALFEKDGKKVNSVWRYLCNYGARAGYLIIPDELIGPDSFFQEDLIKENQLTKREREVLWEISNGKENDEIEKDLNFSSNTLKKHINSINNKLAVEGTRKLVIEGRERFGIFISKENNT